MSGSIKFEIILSIRVLEWLVILVGCKIKGINELEARKLKEGRKEGRKLFECYSKLLPINSATCRLFSCIFYESINIDVSKKIDVILHNLWISNKNVAPSRSHYL